MNYAAKLLGAVRGVFILVKAAYQARRVRRLVFANLDAAYENSYFEPGEHPVQAEVGGAHKYECRLITKTEIGL